MPGPGGPVLGMSEEERRPGRRSGGCGAREHRRRCRGCAALRPPGPGQTSDTPGCGGLAGHGGTRRGRSRGREEKEGSPSQEAAGRRCGVWALRPCRLSRAFGAQTGEGADSGQTGGRSQARPGCRAEGPPGPGGSGLERECEPGPGPRPVTLSWVDPGAGPCGDRPCPHTGSTTR